MEDFRILVVLYDIAVRNSHIKSELLNSGCKPKLCHWLTVRMFSIS